MSNNKLILRSVNSPWVSPFNDITTGSVLSWSDVDNNFIYLKGELIYSALTSNSDLILKKINGNDLTVDLSNFIGEGNRWHIPYGTTVEIDKNYQSFIYGDLYIEGLLKLNDDAQLVVLNGNIIMSGGSISGAGTTLLIQLPEFDTAVTGATFNQTNGIATFTNNSGGTFTLSGLSSSEIFVTGGTYNQNNGVATFTNNSGGTFNVNGFLTGYTNYYTTGTTVVGNTAYFDRTDTLSAYTLNLPILDFTGNTSASCISDIWVANLHGCSPITVHNSFQHITSTASNQTSFAFGDNVIATGTSTHAEGFFTTASGDYSHAEGNATTAIGSSSHAEGSNTQALGLISHAEGSQTTAIGLASHAEGENTIASGTHSHAEGGSTTASGGYSHSEGNSTLASGYISHAQGYASTASNGYSHAQNYITIASGIGSHAEGYQTTASGDYSHSQGSGTTASNIASHSEGIFTTSSGIGSHAEGVQTIASGIYSHAEGQGTTANGDSAHAEGAGTVASGVRSHAEGEGTTASGQFSHSEGVGTKATGNYSHAEGGYTAAIGNLSHAEGSDTTASVDYSHAEGRFSKAFGLVSHAEGYQTSTMGSFSHSEGYITTAQGNSSHSEGNNTKSIGDNSHAEGWDTRTNGSASHAEGYLTTASNTASHAEGFQTRASGVYSHAEGSYTTASGDSSHAEGKLTKATGEASHAEGISTRASGNYSHAGGASTISSGLNSFVHGSGSTASGINTIVLGSGITGVTNDTTYVNNLNIKSIGSGTSLSNLGWDSNGNVVSGSTFSSGNLGRTLYVSISGDNSTAIVGDINKPWADVFTAMSASTSGDTIHIFPQTITLDNTTGSTSTVYSNKFNLWKDGITYYWEAGCKLVILNDINHSGLALFRPNGVVNESCKTIGHLEYEQYSTAGAPAGGSVYYFQGTTIGLDVGYTFYSQTKSQISYCNTLITANRTAASINTTANVIIISDYEKHVFTANMSGGGFANSIDGGDCDTLWKSIVKIREHTGLASFSHRGNMSRTKIFWIGDILIQNSFATSSNQIMQTRITTGSNAVINVNIAKIYYSTTNASANASVLYDFAQTGLGGGVTYNFTGDLIPATTSTNTSVLFELGSVGNVLNYDGNISTNTTSGVGNAIAYARNTSNVINIKGDINYIGTGVTTNYMFKTNLGGTVNYNGKVTGNYANPIATCLTGTININNSFLQSFISGNTSSIMLNGGTTLGTVRINNSYIEMKNNVNAISNGSYVKGLISNSVIVNSGSGNTLENTTAFGLLQLLNSTVISSGTSINYTSTSPVTSSASATNIAYNINTLNGIISTITDITY